MWLNLINFIRQKVVLDGLNNFHIVFVVVPSLGLEFRVLFRDLRSLFTLKMQLIQNLIRLSYCSKTWNPTVYT